MKLWAPKLFGFLSLGLTKSTVICNSANLPYPHPNLHVRGFLSVRRQHFCKKDTKRLLPTNLKLVFELELSSDLWPTSFKKTLGLPFFSVQFCALYRTFLKRSFKTLVPYHFCNLGVVLQGSCRSPKSNDVLK